ncbi:MAG: aspartate--tRNA(Asn) ligase [Candidatus Pacebacteria bacterium]|nr:aspartate--tRNA(Asn) ligase [Candidatus Paceibacterota bacterium]
MKDRILISELHDHIGTEVTVAGYVDVRRDHGKLVFLDIRDRSGKVQAVALPNHPEAVSVAQTLRPEYTVRVRAVVNKRPEKMVHTDQPNGDIELELVECVVLGSAQELPFEKDAVVNLDTLFDNRPFTLRSERSRAIFRVQHEIVRAYRLFLTEQGFTEFQAPKIVGDDAEGGAEVFRFEYFNGRMASLATSPQLYKQIMVGVYERVFSTGAMFRAERHATSRHLNEIAMLDFEMGFIDDHHDVMAMMEALARFMNTHLADNVSNEFATLGATLPLLPKTAFPIMKLREAQQLIKEKTGKDKTGEPDLEPEDERWLCEYAHENLDSDYVFVTHYPSSKRPFYTMDDPDDPGFTKSFDLLFRGVEILSGSQRVHEHDALVEKIKMKGLDPELFAFYLQAFKYGMPPHGGTGLGLERLTQKMLGLENVKEAALFPREINRIDTLLSRPE